jgi:hypothetical protein
MGDRIHLPWPRFAAWSRAATAANEAWVAKARWNFNETHPVEKCMKNVWHRYNIIVILSNS